MKKSVKVIAISLSLAIGLFSPLTAVAATNPNMAKVEQDIRDSATAYLIDDNGYKESLEISVEVKPMALPAQYKNDLSYVNAAAYSAKVLTKTGKLTSSGIEASGALTLTWIDGAGADNSISNLKGHWSVAKGTFDYGRIYWGTNYSTPTSAAGFLDVGDTFNEDIDYTSEDSVFGKLKTMSNGYIISPTDGKTRTLSIQVNPTILD